MRLNIKQQSQTRLSDLLLSACHVALVYLRGTAEPSERGEGTETTQGGLRARAQRRVSWCRYVALVSLGRTVTADESEICQREGTGRGEVRE